MNEKPKKVYALFFAALLVVLLVAFAIPFAEAKSDPPFKIRKDVTSSRYGCSAAPGGTVTGPHINLEIYDNKGHKLLNFHIWTGYGDVYISDGPWCIKIIGKATWKKILEKIGDRLKTKLSGNSIKSLTAAMSKLSILPMIIVPNCNNPSKYDFYDRLMCINGGFGGTYEF